MRGKPVRTNACCKDVSPAVCICCNNEGNSNDLPRRNHRSGSKSKHVLQCDGMIWAKQDLAVPTRLAEKLITTWERTGQDGSQANTTSVRSSYAASDSINRVSTCQAYTRAQECSPVSRKHIGWSSVWRFQHMPHKRSCQNNFANA